MMAAAKMARRIRKPSRRLQDGRRTEGYSARHRDASDCILPRGARGPLALLGFLERGRGWSPEAWAHTQKLLVEDIAEGQSPGARWPSSNKIVVSRASPSACPPSCTPL